MVEMNRKQAAVIGFILFIIIAVSMYLMADYKPLSESLMNDIVIIVSSALCSIGLVFFYETVDK